MREAKRSGIAERLREVRSEWDGEYGAQFFADALGIPLRTWMNYESGVTVPGEVILKLLVTTRISPHWLLSGEGAKFEHMQAKV